MKVENESERFLNKTNFELVENDLIHSKPHYKSQIFYICI
jgi:hypothetical protein